MAGKPKETILHVRGWVNDQIAITVSSSHFHMIYGAFLLSNLQVQEPDWDLSSGLVLAQYIAHQNNVAHTPAIFLPPT